MNSQHWGLRNESDPCGFQKMQVVVQKKAGPNRP
jgi:hypothetical protein